MRRCLICSSPDLVVLRSASDLRADAEWALHHFGKRISDRSHARLKDTAHFTRTPDSDLLRCRACESLSRDERPGVSELARRYREDRYDAELLVELARRFLESYEADSDRLLSYGVSPGARVLEVGSYVGGFLEFARRHGWHATGLDVGAQMAAFARARGLDVVSQPFESADLPREHFDAVWILNCFEQLAESPEATLARAHAVLKPGGLLAIRTPSAHFVSLAYRFPDRVARLLLSGSNLAGVPYLRCYADAALRDLLRGAGFERMAVGGRFPRSLATHAYEGTVLGTPAARDAAFAAVSRLRRRICFPWMDVTARRPPRRVPSTP